MSRLWGIVLLTLIYVKIGHAGDHEGKEIADRLGDDLSFASKQVVRGFTSILSPLLDTAHDMPPMFKIIPFGIGGNNRVGEAAQNFRRTLLRDGVNAFGKGVKASATIFTVPARVAGTGLEEAKKIGQVGMERAGFDSKQASDHSIPPAAGNLQYGIEDGTKVASNLLNNTASKFSQANLGAVLLEVALKNRIKDMSNNTMTRIQSTGGHDKASDHVVASRMADDSASKAIETTPAPPRPVDTMIERFNEAMKNNDEEVMNAFRAILKRINPPKN